MAWILFEDALCQDYNFRCNRVRPRVVKAEFRGSIFGGDFRRRFNGRAKWITHLAGVFPVGVVNVPELVAWLRGHCCLHGQISAQSKCAKMYHLDKIRGQSVECPARGQFIATDVRQL